MAAYKVVHANKKQLNYNTQ